jgi:serine/threonine protein kinase
VSEPLLYPDHNDNSDQKRNAHREENNQKSERGEPEAEGRVLLREVLRQLISSVAFLHERGIVHRDIKPSNIMCKTTPPTVDGIIPRKIDMVHCILGDFSSAHNDFAARNLYANGPSSKEQTDEYAPPEVLFQGPSWAPFSHENPFSYDSWVRIFIF